MISNYKHEIVMAIAMIGLFLAFYYLYGILLPFIIGLILAFLAYPLILKIQKMVRNKDLATTIFLTTIVAIVILFFLFLTQYVNRDFKRLNHSFTVLVSDNKAQLDQAAQKAKMYVGNIYDFDELRSSIKLQADSLASELQTLDYSKLDTEAIAAGFEKIVSVFQSE
jgi:predicted PurR-regulated permease PerM